MSEELIKTEELLNRKASIEMQIELLRSDINKIDTQIENNKKVDLLQLNRLNDGEKFYCVYAYSGLLTIEEDIEDHHSYDTNSYNQNNYFDTKEEAERYLNHFLLQLKLLRVRDRINDGWIPDWNDLEESKYTIHLSNNRVLTFTSVSSCDTPLWFETKEKRELFMKIVKHSEIIQLLKF